MKSLTRKIFVLGRLLLVLALLLQISGVAFAQVWTDQLDYAPGSVVTISGDGNNMQNGQAPYVDGETVTVVVVGPNGPASDDNPNGFSSTCTAAVVQTDPSNPLSAAWSCQVTLSKSGPSPWARTRIRPRSTASRMDNSVTQIVETGTFTDGDFEIYSISPTSGPAAGGTLVTITGKFPSGQEPYTVTIGGVAGHECYCGRHDTLTAITGPHAPGLVDVVVADKLLREKCWPKATPTRSRMRPALSPVTP